jgi:hypothetical protein
MDTKEKEMADKKAKEEREKMEADKKKEVEEKAAAPRA